MLATLTLLLGLPLALASEPPTCAPLVPITFDNTTIPRLLGEWFYIAGATKHPPHLPELRTVKFSAFSLFPGSHEDELNATEIMRRNETCVMKNSSKLQVLHENSTLVHVDENQVVSMARVIQSHEDLLILNHINIDSPSLSLSARTHNVSKEHMEEFKAHLHCLGLTEEDVVYTSMKDACPPPAEKTGEGDADPQVE
ncbi:alpha-1-acid glycoprotein 1-like isoform X2 [Neopelma chrysocephalum]|uniref:alpha-1-acid glycoprotein 1-like isoform X2 n=1 Tax=Neopelma chrysocephalum TaxID=114329 RepID=UPI000FCD1A88|nr:alpha-1-acid glycoprotein 1-like isoform X2 [Neopelma chrysocephalum]